MKKFNIGDRVIVIADNEVKRGSIERIYEEVHTYIVRFDDGSLGKTSYKDIALEPKAETTAEPEAKEKREDAPRMKSEITITPDEFREVAISVLSEYLTDDDMSIPKKLAFGKKVTEILVFISMVLFSEDESKDSDSDE